MPTLAERSFRLALTGVVSDDDPEIVADMQNRIETLEQALKYIGMELGEYHKANIRPTKDELWGLFSRAISTLGSLNPKPSTSEKEKQLSN